MNSLTVCTYNIGPVNDYFLLCKHLNPSDPSLNLKTQEDDAAFRLRYNAAETKAAELLVDKAQVYCLQEVVEEERPLIRALKERNFEIIHLEDSRGFDTAIALDKAQFKDITNHSINVQIDAFFSKDLAIARATHISGQQFVFVSAHAPGFDLTKTVTGADAGEGDFYCLEIAKKLSKIGCNAIQIIGADMNANPEKWNPRFEIFSGKGFQVLRTGLPTNINPRDAVYKRREIDFILTKTPTPVSQEVQLAVQFEASVKAEEVLGWNVDENASDHLPVFVNVSYKTPFPEVSEAIEEVELADEIIPLPVPERTWRERIWQGFLRGLSYLFCCFRDSQENQ